jgi:type VI secretion system protein VasD
VLIAGATLGCGSDPEPKPEPEPTRLQFTISATDDVNPDANGNPSLIATRLFVLRGQSAFASAEFFTLWDKEQTVLARDLLSREELVLKPGQTMTLKSVIDNEARVLGVAAAYQDIDRATWRAMGPLKPAQVNAFKIELSRQAVSLQPLPGEEKQADEKNKKKEEK